MLNGTRLLGCVAAAWLLGGGVGNAASITLDAFNLFVTGAGSLGTAAQVDTADISGTANSHSALVYTKDWVEFHVTPTTLTTATVDVLNNPRTGLPTFPGETYRITSGTKTGTVVFGPTPVTNTPTALLLTGCGGSTGGASPPPPRRSRCAWTPGPSAPTTAQKGSRG